MCVPNQPNVRTVKIGEYAARNPKQQFYIPATEPQPNGSEIHGGQFYDLSGFDKFQSNRTISSSIKFTRSVADKKKDIERIEQITKNTKIDTDSKGKVKPATIKKKVARENNEILFNLIWGN